MRNAPDYVQFYPTLKCNRSCDFCFNRTLPACQDISQKDFSKMVAVLSNASVKTLDILGGEPTLHPHIVSFVRNACTQGLSVNISSNGTNVEMLEKIHADCGAVTIGVSINDRDTYDQISGFVKKHKPVVKTVFSKTTDLMLVTDIFMLQPKKFHLIYRDAVAAPDLDTILPFYRFMSPVQRSFYATANIQTVFCSGFLPETKQYPELAKTRCPAGTTKLGIMPDGSVYPCNLFFGKKDFLLGNILSDPLETIWGHPRLAFFRTFKENPCIRKSCNLHAQCHGGCPAHALALKGDIAAADPRCA